MASASLWLRIAVVQFAPKLGEVHANIAKARELCRGLTPRSVDLVCFPEMCFTGYIFPDAPSIAPYLEHPTTGPTGTFCKALAQRLGCFVVAGVAERRAAPSSGVGAVAVGANTAHLFDPTGRLVHVYRKSNLFPTDRSWACAGGGFAALDLPLPLSLSLSLPEMGTGTGAAGAGAGTGAGLNRVAVAICNDLNVRAEESGEAGTWESIEQGPYELAGWCRKEGVRVLVLLNAWLRPEDGGMEGVEEDGDGGKGERIVGTDGNDDGEDGLEPNWEVLNYWAMRLRPLWAPSDSDSDSNLDHVHAKTDTEEGTRTSVETARDVIVVVCNRFGYERGKTFVGSSAMFSMRPGSGRPRLLHFMGEREEGVRVWTARIRS